MVDFGSALVNDSENRASKEAAAGLVSMTPGYVPPEYIVEENERVKPLDPTFDMWGLAVIVYSTFSSNQ